MEEKIDCLNREKFVNKIIYLITNSNPQTNLSFAINGSWGCGKTFVLNLIKEKLEKEEDYIVFDYNAWENDFYSEPLIAILSCIADKINQLSLSKNCIIATSKSTLKSVGKIIWKQIKILSKTKLGLDIDAIETGLKSIKKEYKNTKINTNFDTGKTLKSAISCIRYALESLNNKLVFFIDEIDRCLPPQAIKNLERVHHIFYNLKNSVCIYALDEDRLKVMIGTYYDDSNDLNKPENYEFDYRSYFDKFYTIVLGLGNGIINENFIKKQKKLTELYNFSNQDNVLEFTEFLNSVMDDLPIRKQLSIIEKILLVHSLTFKDQKLDYQSLMFEIFICVVNYKYNNFDELLNDFISPENNYKHYGDLYDFWEEFFSNIKIEFVNKKRTITVDSFTSKVFYFVCKYAYNQNPKKYFVNINDQGHKIKHSDNDIEATNILDHPQLDTAVNSAITLVKNLI